MHAEGAFDKKWCSGVLDQVYRGNKDLRKANYYS